ncbi:MAG: hypothetical protein RL563_2884 [Pseudomonadota bacterium]|jgi:hypothetical protein
MLTNQERNVGIFYHIYQHDNWTNLVATQLEKLRTSGLYDASTFIQIQINGNEPFPFSDTKYTIAYNKDTELEEAPTLESLRQFCDKNDNWAVLYLHTKGITQKTPETTDWRELMEYFCIERWEDCLDKLQEHDTAGCLYMDQCYLGFHPHYSGNFWWARSEYIKTLNHEYLTAGIRNNREFWIGTGNGSMYSFLNTGLNHYAVRFPRESYVALDNK